MATKLVRRNRLRKVSRMIETSPVKPDQNYPVAQAMYAALAKQS